MPSFDWHGERGFNRPSSGKSVRDSSCAETRDSRPLGHGSRFPLVSDQPLAWLDRQTQNFLNGPTRSQPFIEHVGFYAELSRPLSDWVRLVIQGQAYNIAGIKILNQRRCPSTVARLVITVVVNSVQRGSRRTLAHIGKEVLVGVPTLANTNAAPAIKLVTVVTRVIAPLPHGNPCAIGGRSPCHTVCSQERDSMQPQSRTMSLRIFMLSPASLSWRRTTYLA